MRYETRFEIGAPPDEVWSVLAAIEGWPSWTPTVTALDVLDEGGPGLRPGLRVRIAQPGVSPAVYTVTRVDEGRRFRWESRRPGLRQAADHEIEAAGAGRTRVALSFVVDGPVGRLVSPLVRPTVRRMTDTEATALRERVEKGPAAGQDP